MIKFAGSHRAADIHTGRVYIVGRFRPLMENVPLFTAANHFRASAGREREVGGWGNDGGLDGRYGEVVGGGSMSLPRPK